MSLIEQAAKRLEELRRAGADVTDAPAVSAPPERHVVDASPTPEAVVRALEIQPHAAQPLPLHDRIVQVPAAPSIARNAPRRHDINLAELASRGFLTPDAKQSQTADEFRVIKRPIIRNALASTGGPNSKNRNLVMVTSSLPGEGKTFTAVNLAMSIAMELDNTVLLVDGDVAHPMLPSLLGIPTSPGLLDLLTKDNLDVSDALLRTNVEKLTILPAGSRQRRATELLASEQMAALLRELASRYSDRIIIFDSPPLLATTEARVLATHMDQIVMVVAAESTTQQAVGHALAAIESCEIVLLMLNKARRTDVGAYYGYYAEAGES
jgi:receptor protein-tyrosine kinase